MARIEGLPARKAGLFARLVYWMTRRRFEGTLPEPVAIAAHHPVLLAAACAYELGLERATTVDTGLKSLAELRVATRVGCPF